jgi:hypothetical protein
MYQGFAPELQSARDLPGKLRRDYQRILGGPSDADAAFDFFVTAHHMPEWFYSGDEISANALRKASPLLRVVSNLANGEDATSEAPALRHHLLEGTAAKA